jgi:hypothetical protein
MNVDVGLREGWIGDGVELKRDRRWLGHVGSETGVWNLEFVMWYLCHYGRSLCNGFRISQPSDFSFFKAQKLPQHLISMLP